MPRAGRLGSDAEDRAAEYLLAKGYSLVTRRYKARHGELDLVALDGETLVVVEVKERTKPGLSPEASVDERKAARLAKAAAEYMATHGLMGHPLRFDLICFDADGMRHYKDAFRPG